MANREDSRAKVRGLLSKQAAAMTVGNTKGADYPVPEPAKQASRAELLSKELAQEEEHEELQLRGEQLLKTLRPVYSSTQEQISQELYSWFKHQGFWPDWWMPHDLQTFDDLASRQVTIPFDEYVRLKKMEKLGLVVTEVAEAMEAVRNNDRENEVEELADIDVRLHDYKAGFGMASEATWAFFQKMFKNFQRPFRHGRQF